MGHISYDLPKPIREFHATFSEKKNKQTNNNKTEAQGRHGACQRTDQVEDPGLHWPCHVLLILNTELTGIVTIDKIQAARVNCLYDGKLPSRS